VKDVDISTIFSLEEFPLETEQVILFTVTWGRLEGETSGAWATKISGGGGGGALVNTLLE
jgi:hypothetical protein